MNVAGRIGEDHGLTERGLQVILLSFLCAMCINSMFNVILLLLAICNQIHLVILLILT